jgi:hypothetical protein
MRKHLNKKASRRERNRLKRHSGCMYGTLHCPSDRSKAKAAAHKAYLGQVKLDKEQGLELSRIARPAYREQYAAAVLEAEAQAAAIARRLKRRRKPIRAADTYRGRRRKKERGGRAAIVLRALRQLQGLTRSELDLLRQEEAPQVPAEVAA